MYEHPGCGQKRDRQLEMANDTVCVSDSFSLFFELSDLSDLKLKAPENQNSRNQYYNSFKGRIEIGTVLRGTGNFYISAVHPIAVHRREEKTKGEISGAKAILQTL